MDRNIKKNIKNYVEEKIMKRKMMFLPIVAVATFMLVGYAAVDRKKPVIVSDRISIAYGEKFDTDVIDVTDNHDSRDMIQVTADTSSLNVKQLGTYQVEVNAVDQFNNQATKTIEVDVVDEVAPEFEVLGSGEGYVVEVPINGSNDITSYIHASDNVDGDVTPFIETSKELDASVAGMQTIDLKVSDTSGNEITKTFTFAVSDLEAPVISLKSGHDVVCDYGSQFNLNDYMTITDNIDETVNPVVEGTVDTSKENEEQKVKVTVQDQAGNKTESYLNVTVKDISAPVISLSQSQIKVDKGATVDLNSYLISAIDNKDGDVKSQVKIDSLDTSSTGSKTVNYTVSDQAGNKAVVPLTVEVTFSGEQLVKTATSKLGTPYVWGATGPTSFDCSGFTQWVYRQHGISIPRTSGAQKSAGKIVSLSELQVGDIVWRSGHVGIYIGGGQYIHAPTSGDVVKISNMSSGKFTCGVRYTN